MKKLSFSLSSSKNASKPSNSTSQNQHDQSAKKEFVTEFDPSKTLANSSSKTPFIIPPIPNEWTPQNKITDPNIKPENLNLEFEVEPNSIVEPFDPNIINGLNLREKKSSGSESSSLIDRLMLKNLKRDLERLPEDRGLEEFDDVSVEEFAPALLKGYGWYEGRGIGKNAKEDVKVVQYTKLNAKEGLGFIEKMPIQSFFSKKTFPLPRRLQRLQARNMQSFSCSANPFCFFKSTKDLLFSSTISHHRFI